MNNLNIDVENKWVVLKKGYFKAEFKPEENPFYCEDGFGTSPDTAGTAIFGKYLDGEKARISGLEISRLATDSEIEKKYNKMELTKEDMENLFYVLQINYTELCNKMKTNDKTKWFVEFNKRLGKFVIPKEEN